MDLDHLTPEQYHLLLRARGPIFIYQRPDLVDRYAFVLEIAQLCIIYRAIKVPAELVGLLRSIQQAKPFDIDADDRKRLLRVCQRTVRLSVRGSAGHHLADAIADEIFKLIASHIKYDREIIIRQLESKYTHPFTKADYDDYDKLLKLDTATTTDPAILGQRARINGLMEMRRRELRGRPKCLKT